MSWSSCGITALSAPPEPLFEPARTLGIRWIGYDDGIRTPILEETLLCTFAFGARASGRFSDAAGALDRSLRVFRSLGDPACEAFALAQRGHLHRALDESAVGAASGGRSGFAGVHA